MRLLEATVDRDCDIVLHGDTHEGTKTAHTKAVDKVLRWVMAKPNRYYVHMGDEIEAIVTDDKRFDSDCNEEPKPLRQMHSVRRRYEASKDRCLCWLNGNHSNKLARFGNLTEELCSQLEVPYGTWTCKLQLVDPDGNKMMKLFLTHGFRGTISSNAKDELQRQANMKARLKLLLERKASDCILMACGHTHKLMVVPPSQKLLLRDDGTQMIQEYLGQGDGTADYIEQDRRWYCNTGSFMRLYELGVDSYAEIAGYNPTEMGYCVAKIRNGVLSDIERVVV